MAKGKHQVQAARMRSAIEERAQAQLKARIAELERERLQFKEDAKREADKAARERIERIESLMEKNASNYNANCDMLKAQAFREMCRLAVIWQLIFKRCKERGDWEPVLTEEEHVDLARIFGGVESAWQIMGFDVPLNRDARRTSADLFARKLKVDTEHPRLKKPDPFEAKRKRVASLGKLAKESPSEKIVNDILRARPDCAIHVDTGSNLYRKPHPRPALLTWPSAAQDEAEQP